jgi:hypothetical protein
VLLEQGSWTVKTQSIRGKEVKEVKEVKDEKSGDRRSAVLGRRSIS